MIDALKELIGLVKELPEFALWILLGYLLYKLFIVGSIYGIIRLGINKLHDYLVNKKHKLDIKVHKIGNIVLSDVAYNTFKEMTDYLVEYRVAKYDAECKNLEQKESFTITDLETYFSGKGVKHLTERDCIWLRDAVFEKIKRETSEETSEEKCLF